MIKFRVFIPKQLRKLVRYISWFLVSTKDLRLPHPLPSCIELTGGVQKYAPGTRKEFLWERLIELDKDLFVKFLIFEVVWLYFKAFF
jgi:hypothetical protein